MAYAVQVDPLKEFRMFMRCNICLDSYDKPRTLPCLHTFCTQCLERHADLTLMPSDPNGFHFMCPTCREQISFPSDGILGFRRDFRMEQVKEIISNREKDLQNGTIKPKTYSCSICAGGHDADSDLFYCTDCKKRFCNMCSAIHSQIPVFSTHTLKACRPLRPYLDGDTECPLHPGDLLTYICQDCVHPVCSTCVMTLHGDHQVVEKHSGIKEIMDQLNFHYKTLVTRKGQLRTLLDSVQVNEQETRLSQASLAEKIQERTKQLIDDIYKQEKKLLRELDERTMEEQRRMGNTQHHLATMLSDMSGAVHKTADVLCKEATMGHLQEYDALSKELIQLVEDSLVFDFNPANLTMSFNPTVVRPKLGRLTVSTDTRNQLSSTRTEDPSLISDMIDREAGDREVGDSGILSPRYSPTGVQTSISETSQASISITGDNSRSVCSTPVTIALLARLGKYGQSGGEFSMPRDICFIPDTSNFVVCDTNNERLQVFDTHGLMIKVLGEREIRPWGVTCTPQGEFLISDNADKCIKLLDQNGVMLRKLGCFLCPCGVALTSDQHIVVTDFFSTCAYVMNMSGDVTKQIKYRNSSDKHACGAARVCMTSSDDIIISDVSNAALKAYDRQGRHLWTVSDSRDLLSPQGLCITSNNTILVADAVHHRINKFSVTGEYLGSLYTMDERLKEPTSVTVSDKGYMATVRMKANQIRVYKIAL